MHSQSVVAFRLAMRKLWEWHIVYTRNYIVSALANLKDDRKIEKILLSNQQGIGNAMKPFYGEKAGNRLSTLLKDYILIAADIVSAAKAGDNDGMAAGEKKWRENANEIADFLSGLNPNWPKEVLAGMLHRQIDFTTAEIVSRLKKDWAADIEAYDKGYNHMMMFADVLTDGIAKQFPEKVRDLA
jgi:hypothetical protein